MKKTEIAIATFFFLILAVAMVVSTDSEDIDEICNIDNAMLYRVNGTWQCAQFSTNAFNQTITYNINTTIIQVLQINETDPHYTANLANIANIKLNNQFSNVTNFTNNVMIGDYSTTTAFTKAGNSAGNLFYVGTTGAFRVERSTGNSEAFRVNVNGNSQGTWLGTANGNMKWGNGTAAQDVLLTRTTIHTMRWDTDLIINGTILIGNTTTNTITCTATTEGTMIYNTTLHQMTYCNSTAWKPI